MYSWDQNLCSFYGADFKYIFFILVIKIAKFYYGNLPLVVCASTFFIITRIKLLTSTSNIAETLVPCGNQNTRICLFKKPLWVGTYYLRWCHERKRPRWSLDQGARATSKGRAAVLVVSRLTLPSRPPITITKSMYNAHKWCFRYLVSQIYTYFHLFLFY